MRPLPILRAPPRRRLSFSLFSRGLIGRRTWGASAALPWHPPPKLRRCGLNMTSRSSSFNRSRGSENSAAKWLGFRWCTRLTFSHITNNPKSAYIKYFLKRNCSFNSCLYYIVFLFKYVLKYNSRLLKIRRSENNSNRNLFLIIVLLHNISLLTNFLLWKVVSFYAPCLVLNLNRQVSSFR